MKSYLKTIFSAIFLLLIMFIFIFSAKSAYAYTVCGDDQVLQNCVGGIGGLGNPPQPHTYIVEVNENDNTCRSLGIIGGQCDNQCGPIGSNDGAGCPVKCCSGNLSVPCSTDNSTTCARGAHFCVYNDSGSTWNSACTQTIDNCATQCTTTIKYKCNTGTKQCAEDSTGTYTSLSTCNTACGGGTNPPGCGSVSAAVSPNSINTGDPATLQLNGDASTYWSDDAGAGLNCSGGWNFDANPKTRTCTATSTTGSFTWTHSWKACTANCTDPSCCTTSCSVNATYTVGRPAPPEPTGLSASCREPGTSAAFNWSVSQGADYYLLSVNNGSETRAASTTATVTGMTPGSTDNSWTLKACNSSNTCSSRANGPVFNCAARPPAVTLSGSVKSTAGAGIPNVTLNCDNLPFSPPTTDSGGNFSVANVPLGTVFCLRAPQVSGYQNTPATVQGNNVPGQSYECQTAGRYSDPDSCSNQNGTTPPKSVDLGSDNQYNFVYAPNTVSFYRFSETRFEASDAGPQWKTYDPAAEPIKEQISFPDNAPAGQIKVIFAQFKDSNNIVSRVFQNSITYRPASGPTCTNLAPVGLTDTGNIDGEGRTIYRMDSSGGFVRINASRSPAATVMTGSSSSTSLTFNPHASSDGSIVATVPANTSTTADVDYVVSVTVGSPPVNCTPAGFVIRVAHVTPQGSACTNFAPAGLIEVQGTDSFDYAGRRRYRTGDSSGGNVRIGATRIPSDAGMTGSSTPAGVTFDRDAENPGAIIGVVPANTTVSDRDYVIKATIPGSSGFPADCNPEFIIRVPGRSCTGFAPIGLIDTGNFDGENRKYYRIGDSSGGFVRINATRSPSSAVMTGSNSTGVTLRSDVANQGGLVGDVPANTSQTADVNHLITASIPDNVNCTPSFYIRVPKAQTDRSCPSDIKSTEVKFKQGNIWVRNGVRITKGQSVTVAGFHNGETPDTPPSDIILKYAGPNGETGGFATNNYAFTPEQTGDYTVTALTKDKDTDTYPKCKGSSTFTVQAQAATACTAFSPVGLTDTGDFDDANRKYYRMGDSSGGNVRINATRSPSDAEMTGRNTSGVTFKGDVANAGGMVGAVPSNTSTSADANHLITATIPKNPGTVDCSPPFYIRVPKAQVDNSCPSEIESTQVKFKQGLWLSENVSIQKGSPIRIAGFHNGETPDTPPSDIILRYSGPNGETGSFSINDQTFTPAQVGTYSFTAKTKEKTGANCEGTSAFTVQAQAKTAKEYRFSETRFEASDAGPQWKTYNPAAEPIKEQISFPDNAPAGQIKVIFAQFKDSNNRAGRVFQNSITYSPASGPTCTNLAPVGLTGTGNIDGEDRKIYRMDSSGGFVRINASRSPATIAMTGSSDPSLTFNPSAGNDGSIVATIPANISTQADKDYVVSVRVGNPAVDCTPTGFVIRVVHATPQGSACINFAPAGLTEVPGADSFDYAGRRRYRTGDSSGGNVRIGATRTPSDAGMTGTSTPAGVTFDRDVTNPGAIVGAVPANTGTALDRDYVIKATIPGASGSPADCNPEFIIRVPKAQVDNSCPSDIKSTEVKFKQGNIWVRNGVRITKGQSVTVAGFHNGETPDTPPSDIILKYAGPNGETGSLPANNYAFTPEQTGNYTVTALTKDKTGANCEASSSFTVDAQAATACTAFSPVGLTDTGDFDDANRKYYRMGDSSGGNVRINATRSPSDAEMTGRNTSGVTFKGDVANAGGMVGAVPSNTSTSADANHLITATISKNPGTVDCSPPFYIRVPKAQIDNSCPSDIESTQVKFKQGLWLSENVFIQKGSSIRIAGFHNGETSDTPPPDIILRYSGPNGETGSFSINDQTFTPAQVGTYSFTAKTREKTGANCEGTSAFTVQAQAVTACTAFSPGGLQPDSQTGPNGMKIYNLPDYKGGRRLLNVVRSPADAAINPSFTKAPASASDLTFENMADGSGNKIVNIPDNNSNSQNADYTLSAAVTGTSTKQCTPFMIHVPKKPLVTACPDNISSTEARIKVSNDDFWSRENTVVIGNSVFVAGFHNGTDNPANDAVLTVAGPEGPRSRIVTLNPNTEHIASFRPDLSGRYTVTASTLNKEGARCTGTGVLTVDPGTSCPSEVTSTEARLRRSDKEAWSNEKEMTLGESILAAGFHNNQTEEFASDIILRATGPEGPQSSVKVINSNNNNVSFKPTLAGNYRITAVTKGKSGEKCTGSASLKVSPPAVTTTSFRIAENPADLETAPWQPYTAEGMRVEHDFKKAGDKFIFVQFMDSTGKTTTVTDCPKCRLQIKILGPDPQVLSCSLSTSGNSVLATLKGRNFGKDKGTVKTGDASLTVKSWKDDVVEAVLSNPAVGESLPVEVVNTEGQASSGAICSSLSTLSVGATFFCHSRQDRAQSNVELTLVEQTAGAKPLKQKVTIDKEGVIAGLTGVLQEGKDYKLSLKGPRTVRKTKLFTAGSGTTNVPDFVLPVGDIFPLGGDGVINSLDKAELNRQWVISKDVKERTADYNNDGRVNSIDWACMRKDFGASNDAEPVAPTGTASSCSINALGKPLDPEQTFDDPNTVQFVSSAAYSGRKSIAAARWDFQNKGEWDTDLNAESVSPYYTYPAAGEYTVRLQVQLFDGEMTPVCTRKITVPIKEEKEEK